MRDQAIDRQGPLFSGCYSGVRVLLTGDTGFKGAWLSVWLGRLGAEVHGLALPPANDSALFVRLGLQNNIKHHDGNICDLATVERTLVAVQPRIIFHLAAQALVRESYRTPLETVMTNVMGTAHLCDALRRYSSPCAMVVVTSDKCYENQEWVYGYRENDAMGGGDPYSASKGAAELITTAWRHSFFPVENLPIHEKIIASARAGNVVGPGDWGRDRIVPDAIRALLAGQPVSVRNPGAVRPWQHVLEPLSGYLWLGAQLMGTNAADFAGGWNFGPLPGNMRTVQELVERVLLAWGSGAWQTAGELNSPKEAHLLRLVIDKAVAQLNWLPVWSFHETIQHTVEGYRLIRQHWHDLKSIHGVVESQIADYEMAAKSMNLAWAG